MRQTRASTSAYAETPKLVSRREDEVPEHVRRLRILLPNDREFIIVSRTPD